MAPLFGNPLGPVGPETEALTHVHMAAPQAE